MIAMTGVILAGGKSLRMKTNKAFVQLKGKPLVVRIGEVLSRLFEEVIVVANDPKPYEGTGYRVVPDIFGGKGPLAGVHSGLVNASHDRCFVAACDMPFISEELVRYMSGRCESYDVVVPEVSGRYQPIHAVYSKRCIAVAEKYLSLPWTVKAFEFYKEVRLCVIAEEELESFGNPSLLFFNINTIEDLRKAEQILETTSEGSVTDAKR